MVTRWDLLTVCLLLTSGQSSHKSTALVEQEGPDTKSWGLIITPKQVSVESDLELLRTHPFVVSQIRGLYPGHTRRP